MGRPKKPPEELRDSAYVLRLTEQERAAVEQRAAAFGIPLSEFFRRRALGHPLPASMAERQADAALTTALLRLGVNLNQIAKHMNAGRSAPPHLEPLIAEIAAHVERLSHDPGGDRQGPQL